MTLGSAAFLSPSISPVSSSTCSHAEKSGLGDMDLILLALPTFMGLINHAIQYDPVSFSGRFLRRVYGLVGKYSNLISSSRHYVA